VRPLFKVSNKLLAGLKLKPFLQSHPELFILVGHALCVP
jgi:hypothetical protein